MKRKGKRQPIPKAQSKKLFARTAKGVHPKNLKSPPLSRGGIRL